MPLKFAQSSSRTALLWSLLAASACGGVAGCRAFVPQGGASHSAATSALNADTKPESVKPVEFDPMPNGLKTGGRPLETEFHVAPVLPSLTTAEVGDLLHAAQGLGLPSTYIKSGCHDRAHLLWLTLPASLRTKTGKIWVFSLRVLTLAVTTPITIKGSPDSPKWGYHVAVAYRTAGRVHILDSTVPESLETPYSARTWIDQYLIPPGSLTVLLEADLYLFHSNFAPSKILNKKGEEMNLFSNTNQIGLVNTGQFFKYEGDSQTNMYIENAVARDEVGAVLLQHSDGCEWASVVDDPDKLLAALQDKGEPPTACKKAATVFRERVSHWHSVVSSKSSN
jgi:hypothetical protein